jgi:hypothetical protein
MELASFRQVALGVGHLMPKEHRTILLYMIS